MKCEYCNKNATHRSWSLLLCEEHIGSHMVEALIYCINCGVNVKKHWKCYLCDSILCKRCRVNCCNHDTEYIPAEHVFCNESIVELGDGYYDKFHQIELDRSLKPKMINLDP